MGFRHALSGATAESTAGCPKAASAVTQIFASTVFEKTLINVIGQVDVIREGGGESGTGGDHRRS